MPFSAKAVDIVTRTLKRADKAAGEALNEDLDTLAQVFRKRASELQPLVDELEDKTDVPPDLAALGVSQETWHQAEASKATAIKYRSAAGPGGFTKAAVGRMAKEIAKAEGLRKKSCRPVAIAALQAAAEEPTPNIAIAFHDAGTA